MTFHMWLMFPYNGLKLWFTTNNFRLVYQFDCGLDGRLASKYPLKQFGQWPKLQLLHKLMEIVKKQQFRGNKLSRQNERMVVLYQMTIKNVCPFTTSVSILFIRLWKQPKNQTNKLTVFFLWAILTFLFNSSGNIKWPSQWYGWLHFP